MIGKLIWIVIVGFCAYMLVAEYGAYVTAKECAAKGGAAIKTLSYDAICINKKAIIK